MMNDKNKAYYKKIDVHNAIVVALAKNVELLGGKKHNIVLKSIFNELDTLKSYKLNKNYVEENIDE